MFDEILKTVEKRSKEELDVSVGLAVLAVIGAFLIGLIMGHMWGSCSAKRKTCKCGKKKHSKASAEDFSAEEEDFDAEQYVRNLSFDGE